MTFKENEQSADSIGHMLVLVLLCVVFLTDLFTQLGFAHGILYLPVRNRSFYDVVE